MNAVFRTEWVDHRRRIVFVKDIGHKRAMSVTNDAERVVAWLNRVHPGYRIIYCDSMSRWDEMLHLNGRFIGFAPGFPPLGRVE